VQGSQPSTRGGRAQLIKTIVATAVIVFALTTVAMAGVQRLGHEGGGRDRERRRGSRPRSDPLPTMPAPFG
jgi:hypothetical protein